MAFGTAAGRAVLEDWIVNQNHGEVSISAHSGDPGADGTANEITGGSYARASASDWQLHQTDKSVSLVGNVDIAGMPADDVTHLGIWCGSTFFCPVDCNDVSVESGETLRISGITITA